MRSLVGMHYNAPTFILILYAVFIVHGALHSQNTFHTVVYVHSGFLYYNLKDPCQRGTQYRLSGDTGQPYG
jgi:hypothetical protein